VAKTASRSSKSTSPEAARARRLEKLAAQGPPPPRSPHEFIEKKMRDERRARTRAPGLPKK
jgi:hypothetical protein